MRVPPSATMIKRMYIAALHRHCRENKQLAIDVSAHVEDLRNNRSLPPQCAKMDSVIYKAVMGDPVTWPSNEEIQRQWGEAETQAVQVDSSQEDAEIDHADDIGSSASSD